MSECITRRCFQSFEESARLRARAICCHWCPHAEHSTDGPWTGTAVTCTVNGASVEAMVLGGSCPKDRFPDEPGYVVRGFIRWFGVPAYERWALRGRLTGPVPGCGCTVIGKRAWVVFRTRHGGWWTIALVAVWLVAALWVWFARI